MKDIRLLICGDLVVTEPNFGEANLNKDILKLFANSDLNISNLECPITDSNSKIIKTGPHLKGSSLSTEKVIKSLNIDLVTLANNHIMDYGKDGLKDTLNFCKENSMHSVGVGKNAKEAREPFRTEINGVKISILNFAENEWASADEDRGGANSLDIVDNTHDIRSEKKISERVIVIVHGGHEYYNLPSPRMQKLYRFYIENGADLIIGHHPHCISGYEEYHGKMIYYSLGNFLFTKKSSHKDWYQGLVLEVIINSEGKLQTATHFIEQNKNDFSLSLMRGIELEKELNRFNKFSNIIKNEAMLKEEWRKFVNDKKKEYLWLLSPAIGFKNRFFRAILYRLGYRGTNKTSRAFTLNFMRCEAHRELSKEILERSI